jgi:hypothetical protein
MRKASRTATLLASAGAIAAIAAVATPHRAAAGGFFDIFTVFGGSHDGRYAPVNAYSDPTPAVTRPLDLQAPPSLSQGITYCVRLCDGRYFPLSSAVVDSRDGGAKMCSALCPAAKTAIFRGGDIDQAYGVRGERYTDLDQAFVYRNRVIPDCTCNGQDAFGLAHIDPANDPTLRPGDMIATAKGLSVFRGTQSARGTAQFTPVRRDTASAEVRRMLAATQASRGN